MKAKDLIAFEREVAERYERGEIRGPIHLSGGNEEQLIEIFHDIPKDAWIFSNWRSHYHALLHGIPPEKVMAEILAGRSMNLNFPEYRFFTSAIVGGILPIAVGVAYSGRKVWCFVGDMTWMTGIYRESYEFSRGHNLPIHFVIEDNGYSTNSPTFEVWGDTDGFVPSSYHRYIRTYPHVGTGKHVSF